MRTITIEIPDDVSLPIPMSEDDFAREVRLAAAIHWYSQGSISQGKAAEFAGISRQSFLEALYRAGVPACQVTPDELAEELHLGRPTDR